MKIQLTTLALLLLVALPSTGVGQPSEDKTTAGEESVQETSKPSIRCTSIVPPEELGDAERVALRGVACFEAGEYIQALRHYRRAFEVSESPLLMGAIGRVFQEMGYPALAREYYNSYLLAEVDEKEKISARLADVDKKLDAEAVPVRIESNPPGARIFIVMSEDHWELAGDAPIETRLLPGKYNLVARRDGYKPLETSIEVPERDDPVNVKKSVSKLELEDPNALFDTSKREWHERGMTVILASIPFVAAGSTMLAIGLGKEKDSVELTSPQARDEMNRDANRLKTWGAASLAVGATGVVVGSILYLIGNQSDSGDAEAEVGGWTTQGGGGASATVRW